jgi:hypothetical protein
MSTMCSSTCSPTGSLNSQPNLGVVFARFRYIEDSERFRTEKPYHFSGPLDPSEEEYRTNMTFVWHDDVAVRDLRSCLGQLNLGVHGFKFIKYDGEYSDISDNPSALAVYMNQMTALVQEHLAAEAVICYDYRVLDFLDLMGALSSTDFDSFEVVRSYQKLDVT